MDKFRSLIECLTGTPVKDLTDRDQTFLAKVLQNDDRQIDCSQFNELLLLVNKDRVELPFFNRFFRPGCKISGIRGGVERFQEMALLCFGNFIFAYRTLSRIRTDEALEAQLGEYARNPASEKSKFQERAKTLIEVERIERNDTSMVGYLSAGAIIAEHERALYLRKKIPTDDTLEAANWDTYLSGVIAAGSKEEREFRKIIDNFRTGNKAAAVADFRQYLDGIIPLLAAKSTRLDSVRAMATRNQDVYLTWDHMDVYFATSMRKKWEFEDLFDFVNGVMTQSSISELNVRFFDPTQSFTADRINKGLVESLMLKRAKCTVYSVQDTDTLGKDSELAATLAQGKPVIAYVPRIVATDRAGQLLTEDPVTIQDRLRFVIYADEYFASSLTADDLLFVQRLHDLETFEQQRIWRSIPDEEATTAFRAAHHQDLERICRIIASSEARIYDKRASTLTKTHPLGIQVNLSTGVANGVLVVRSLTDCASLLRRILTNEMEFDLEEDNESRMWYLRERISGCIFRVVSKDRKLTNCFWNYYRRQ